MAYILSDSMTTLYELVAVVLLAYAIGVLHAIHGKLVDATIIALSTHSEGDFDSPVGERIDNAPTNREEAAD